MAQLILRIPHDLLCLSSDLYQYYEPAPFLRTIPAPFAITATSTLKSFPILSNLYIHANIV